jgi:hypothetical protein
MADPTICGGARRPPGGPLISLDGGRPPGAGGPLLMADPGFYGGVANGPTGGGPLLMADPIICDGAPFGPLIPLDTIILIPGAAIYC